MSQKKNKPSHIDGRLAFAQMDADAQRVIVRAALSQHMADLGRRVNNLCEKKRAKVSIGQKRRWQLFREQREAARQAEIAKHGYPPDWQFPPKPKKKRVYTRAEALEILSKEMDRKFPHGLTKENEKEFMSYRSKDPRLEGHV